MRNEDTSKIKELIAKYPQFFSGRALGYGCGNGWIPIIETACSLINSKLTQMWCKLANPTDQASCARLPKDVLQFQFDQIKEKFGGLRLYYHVKAREYSDLEDSAKFSAEDYSHKIRAASCEISGIISMAEAMAGITCEFTGNPGILSVPKDGGWMKTMSPAYAATVGYIPYAQRGTQEEAEIEEKALEAARVDEK